MRKIATIIIAGALAASAPAGAEDAPKHAFQGQWITSAEFANAEPVNVFHRQYDFESGKRVLEKSKALQNRHTLFRGEFFLDELPKEARLFFSADDYAKIYVNGKFAAQGPALDISSIIYTAKPTFPNFCAGEETSWQSTATTRG